MFMLFGNSATMDSLLGGIYFGDPNDNLVEQKGKQNACGLYESNYRTKHQERPTLEN